MRTSRTLFHTLHDLGLFAWFGGTLMGVVGLHGASGEVADPRDRVTVAQAGWRRFGPIQSGSILAYWIGATGLARTDWSARPVLQAGIVPNDVARITLAVSATVLTAVNALLGRRIAAASGQPDDLDPQPVHSATEPSGDTPPALARLQRRQDVLQWITPACLAAVVVLAGQRNEAERTPAVARGVWRRVRGLVV